MSTITIIIVVIIDTSSWLCTHESFSR